MRTPTFATCADRRRRAAAGFTLVELLVVLAMAGLLIALVPASLQRLRETMQYRDAVRTVASDLRVARQRAITEGIELRFTVDLPGRSYGVEGRPARELPQPLEMRVVLAGVEWTAGQKGAIRFLPQGGATGGTVDIVRPSGAGTRLTVDWLTGGITQIALQQPT